jgi:hypothetical protein
VADTADMMAITQPKNAVTVKLRTLNPQIHGLPRHRLAHTPLAISDKQSARIMNKRKLLIQSKLMIQARGNIPVIHAHAMGVVTA